MYELRVVALSEDARYVVLAPVLEGRRERYRVAVDDRLRAALRGELGRLERKIRPDSALTPREIQARVRAGETAETIAAAAGVAVEWVLRFETPVLAERAQVARQARHASLSVSGGEWTGVPLEEIVAARLEADGNRPEAADWDAWRREDGRWVLQLRVGSYAAHWLWDPALQRLVVHDDAARSLLHPDGPSAGPPIPVAARRLALAPEPVVFAGGTDVRATADAVPEPLEPELVVELRSETSPASGADPAEPDPALPDPPEPGQVPADGLGDGLGEGPGGEPAGTERADPVMASDAGDEAAVDLADDLLVEPDVDPAGTSPADPAGEVPADPPRAARRSGRRKSVPSWEDILLGTGTGVAPGTGTGSGSQSG